MCEHTRNSTYTTMTQLLGCRGPLSNGIGLSDHVFMYVASDDIQKTVLFENGAFRFLENEKFLEYYDYFVKRGWKPMTLQDLRLTSGIDGVHYFQCTRFSRVCYLLRGTAILMSMGFLWLCVRRKRVQKAEKSLMMSPIRK